MATTNRQDNMIFLRNVGNDISHTHNVTTVEYHIMQL